MARRLLVEWVVCSKMKESVLKLLKQYSFITNYEQYEVDNKKFLKVHLKEVHDKIQDVPVIKFYSKPSRRWYIWYKEIKSVAGWQWIGIISTSKGLLATHIAKKEKVWWELIAEIY